MDDQTHTITRDDQVRSGSIRYTEHKKSLSLYYETDERGFVAYAENPLYWNSPVRELVDMNQRKQILERIEQWIDSEKLKIQIIR